MTSKQAVRELYHRCWDFYVQAEGASGRVYDYMKMRGLDQLEPALAPYPDDCLALDQAHRLIEDFHAESDFYYKLIYPLQVLERRAYDSVAHMTKAEYALHKATTEADHDN